MENIHSHEDSSLIADLHEARKIQMGMLPEDVPEFPGFQIAAHSTPAIAVGGDFYDFIPLGQGKLGVVIGDAVGHGIAAALLMTMTLTDFRSIAPREMSPATVLNSINRRLTQGMRSRAFVTSIYAVLDRTSNRLTCAMAGMQPWLIKANSGSCIPIEPSEVGFPLGASKKSFYQSCELEMERDDALVLFTDGIPEAMNASDDQYSFERFEQFLAENWDGDAQGMLDAVLTDVRQFAGGHSQEDDITLVVLKATESFVAVPTIRPRQLIAGEQKSVTAVFGVADGNLSDTLMNSIRTQVREYGGIVDVMGDDMLVALFGVPAIREDDAERAIAAANAIQSLETDLTFRMGVNTGTAVVRADTEIDYRELGETIYQALHLANATDSGKILVGEKTYQLTRGTFQFDKALSIEPPVVDAPLPAYAVIASAEKPHRVRGIEGLYAPLIGRESEIENLTACLDDLLDGRGGIISITGEAGLGKSRLVSEFQALAGDRVQWLEGRCLSYGQAMSYSPFRGIIGSYLGIIHSDSEDVVKAKLEERVNALLPEVGRWTPIHIGRVFFPQYEKVLRTASGDDYAKQYTFPIMRNVFEKIAYQKPLIMVFDDLHWADPTTLALLEYLMENVDEAPILYFWVYRPERSSACWRLREEAARNFTYCNTEIDLTPLQDEQTNTLTSELLKIPDIPEQMRRLVQEKAKGNPLYVEEIIRSFIDTETVVRDAEYWRATMENAEITPSDTLQSVILSRVDRLDSDPKEILQVASIVGDSFALPLLEQVTKSPSNLSHSLRELERTELLQHRRVRTETEYRFRHPLIYDVVYHSLLPEDRATLHERTGVAIEMLYSEKLDDFTDQLAHHYGKSENIEKALYYLTLAGDKAKELRSYWEELDYYGLAMKKAEDLADEHQKKQVIVDLVKKRSGARHMLGCLKADVEELEKYVGWAEELGDRASMGHFYFHLITHRAWQGERIAPAFKYLKRLADTGADDWKYVEGLYGHRGERLRSFDYLLEGKYEAAIALDVETVEAAEREDEVHSFCNASGRLARAYRTLGRWNESFATCQAVVDFANKHNLSTRIIQGHHEYGTAYLSMGEWEKTIEACEAALSMSPSGLTIPWVVTPLGDAYCRAGQLDKGINLLESWKAYARRVGRGQFYECEYSLPLAEGYLAKGDVDKARANAGEALQIALEKAYSLHEAQAYRILGEIHAPTDFSAAEDYFTKSVEIMQRIKAKNEEGKTELSWGRVCKERRDIEQAQRHLTQAAEIFEALGTERYLEWTRQDLASC